MTLLDQIYAQAHVVITASLKLRNGNFLQPTGFPDIGACIYRDKDGRRWCLVESEQSMSNRLEAVCMKSPGVWVDELKGLPLIVVRGKNGVLLATNLTEPHRIASSYILEGKPAGKSSDLRASFESKLGLQNGGDFWPLDKRAELEKLVFALDPAALLHGFQFVQWKFVGLRQTRLIHARLEAELADDSEVHYGMVKVDQIDPNATREERANKGQSIAAKSRIVPKNIIATFDIDVLALKGLSLKKDKKKFLLGLALWKIGAFLGGNPSFDPRSRSNGLSSLRLRADCHLELNLDEPISWIGNSSEGRTTTTTTTTTDELMGAKPAGLGSADGNNAEEPVVNFEELVKEALPDNGGAAPSDKSDKNTPIYEGPLVEVTYEQKSSQPAETQPSQKRTGDRRQQTGTSETNEGKP